MNKFILVLLIAVASSATIEFDGSNLEGFLDLLKSVWGSIKNFFSKLPGYLSTIYKKLKDLNIIEKLLDYLEKYGKPKAVEYCKSWIGSDLCSDIVDYIFDLIKSVAK